MPAFPEFDDDSLTALTNAFRVRSKAITYHASGWTITLETSNGELERMNVDANGHHGDIRLSVWADRVVWFRLCRGRAKNGWDFMLSFNGDASDISPDTIVEQFVASIASDDHLSIWRNVSPAVERSVPSA